MPESLRVFLEQYLCVQYEPSNIGGGIAFSPIDNFSATFLSAVDKFNKDTKWGINRQDQNKWYPVSANDAIEDFATPELEHSFYLYITEPNGHTLDCNVNCNYCDYC